MKFLKFLKFFFFALSCFVHAQKDFNFIKISTLSQDDGLSQGANYFKFEDRKGFMWLSGSDAVERRLVLVRKTQNNAIKKFTLTVGIYFAEIKKEKENYKSKLIIKKNNALLLLFTVYRNPIVF